MIAAYLGDEKFKDGVRLHLKRHAYGNATSEQFFQSIADAAKDPRSSDRVQELRRPAGRSAGRPSAATMAGWSRPSRPTPSSATSPPRDHGRSRSACALARPSNARCSARRRTRVAIPGSGTIMPNVGGTGYYRFDLAPEDWKALIASSAQLSPGEAVATTDSLWASFRAGRAPAAWLIDEARAMAANPDASASVEPGRPPGGPALARVDPGIVGARIPLAYQLHLRAAPCRDRLRSGFRRPCRRRAATSSSFARNWCR